MRFWAAYGKTFLVLYVCFASPEADPENGEREERSGIPKNVLDCHRERRVTRRQPDLAIVCIQERVHVMLPSLPCRLRPHHFQRQPPRGDNISWNYRPASCVESNDWDPSMSYRLRDANVFAL